MTKNVPAWALNHLRENLPRDAAILNVQHHRRGVVVANTRIGAAVVTKRLFGEPVMSFLANPRERVRFDCQVCAESLEFRRLELPALVHCGLCGSRYAIDQAGIVEVRERMPWTEAPALAPKPPAADGPFTYGDYTLHRRDVELKNGKKRMIYFFAKHVPRSGEPCPKPDGFHVGVNERTGLPFLKRGQGEDGEDLTPEAEHAYRPQCVALTDEGHQCRNSARAASKYCASHFGYQPTAIPVAQAKRQDTRPRVRAAPDTTPAVRKAKGSA